MIRFKEIFYSDTVTLFEGITPRYPKDARKSKKIANKGTNNAWEFDEYMFKTKIGNVVRFQIIPDGESAVELSFTVNDGFDDVSNGGKFDSGILSGVLGIFDRVSRKNMWNTITFKFKTGDKDFKIIKNTDIATAKSKLLDKIDEIDEYRERNNINPRWLVVLNNRNKILTGEFDASKIASMLYMSDADAGHDNNAKQLREEVTVLLEDYHTALETKLNNGRKIVSNRRERVFLPMIQKILSNYTLSKEFGTFTFTKN
jgi:hypothetical protein